MFNEAFSRVVYIMPSASVNRIGAGTIKRIVFEFDEDDGRALVVCDDQIEDYEFGYALGLVLEEYEEIYGHGISVYKQPENVRYRYITNTETFETFREEYRIDSSWDEERFPKMRVVNSPLSITEYDYHEVEWKHVSDFLDISLAIGLIREVDGEYAAENMVVCGSRYVVRPPRDVESEPGWSWHKDENTADGVVDADETAYVDDEDDEPEEYQGRPCARLSDLMDLFGGNRH